MNYDISKWSTEQLVDLLNHSGYTEDGIISASYKQTLNEGHIVFNIDYETLEGDIESGNVFVFIRDGKLVAEY